jgi:uncharacterized repeat protein (TIGR01451 family)
VKIRKFLLIPVMALVLLGTMVSFGGTMYSPSPALAQPEAVTLSIEVPDTVAPGEDLTWRAVICCPGDGSALNTLSYRLILPGSLGIHNVRLNHCPFARCSVEDVDGEIWVECYLGQTPDPAWYEVELVNVTAHVPYDYHYTHDGICAVGQLWYQDEELMRQIARKTELVPRADLRVQKMVKPEGQVPAGVEISYSIIVENLGPSAARSVSVHDYMFSGWNAPEFEVTMLQPSTPGAWNCDPIPPKDTITHLYCNRCNDIHIDQPMPPGLVETIYITAKSDDPGTINNKVWVSSPDDPILCNNVAHASIDVTPLADLALTKTVAPPDTVDACDTLTYTFRVLNQGPSTAHNVVVRDVLPAEVSLVSVSVPNGSYDAGIPGDPLNPLTVNLNSLADEESRSFTVTVKVKDDTPPGTILFNGATVSSDTPEASNYNNSCSQAVTVTRGADLRIEKTATPDPDVYAGQILTYDIFVENIGSCTAKNVVVKDVLPEQVTMVGVTALPCGASYNAGVPGDPLQPFTVNIGSIGAGGNRTITVECKVKNDTPNGTIIFNNASVTSDTPDVNNGNNLASVATNVVAEADLSITKSANAATYRAYQTMVYTVTVHNAGPCDAFDVVVIDYMPPAKQAQYLYATADVFQDGPNLICKLGDIPSGGTKTFEIYMQILPFRGNIDNNASVACPIPDPVPTNNNVDPTVTVRIIS